MKRRSLLAAAAAGLVVPVAARAATSASANPPSVLFLWRAEDGGQRLEVRGHVFDAAGRAANGTEVYIRHANPAGIYTGEYEGAFVTDARGGYAIRTALPGIYGRPRHIHVTASHPSAGYTVTEIVFKGDPMLAEASQENGIILETLRSADGEVLTGNFDFQLQG